MFVRQRQLGRLVRQGTRSLAPAPQLRLMGLQLHTSRALRNNDDDDYEPLTPQQIKAKFLRQKQEREEKAAREEAEREAAAERAEDERLMSKITRNRLQTGANILSSVWTKLDAYGDSLADRIEDQLDEATTPMHFFERYYDNHADEDHDRLPIALIDLKIKELLEPRLRKKMGGVQVDEHGNILKPEPEPEVETSEEMGLELHESEKTVSWDKTMDDVKQRLRSTTGFRVLRGLERQFEASDNEYVKKLREAKEQLGEKLGDARESWETAGSPLMMGLRSGGGDGGETEQSAALKKLLALDPDFDSPKLLRQLEGFLIPVILTAWRKPLVTILDRVLDGVALSILTAELRTRIAERKHMDPRTLDIRGADILEIKLDDEGEPVVNVMFMCGHVDCWYDEKGRVVDGDTTKFVTAHYVWHLKRNLEDREFPWKVVHFQTQVMQRLV